MANHDFAPSTNFTYEEPGVFRLRALRDVAAGEEVKRRRIALAGRNYVGTWQTEWMLNEPDPICCHVKSAKRACP